MYLSGNFSNFPHMNNLTSFIYLTIPHHIQAPVCMWEILDIIIYVCIYIYIYQKEKNFKN